MLIDCIADLHGYYPILEGGDLLIVAGDLTARDEDEEYLEFFKWISDQHYEKIVWIGGNHDNALDNAKRMGTIVNHRDFPQIRYAKSIEYLCDSGTEFEGLKIYGSPWSPLFKGVNPHCTAFMLPDEHLHNKWIQIPEDTDILITHCPPFGTLDYSEMSDGTRYHMGSKSLEAWLKCVGRPSYHVFGHIHEGYGIAEEYPLEFGLMMKSINCSLVNEKYQPVNKPINFEI